MSAAIKSVARALGSASKGPAALAENATREARVRLEDARADLERTDARQAEAIAQAREVFDADPSETNADTVAQCERRADVLLRHGKQRVAVSEAALKQVEKAELDAKLAALDEVVNTIDARLVAQFGPLLQEHLTSITKLLSDADAVARAATDAGLQAHKLRGEHYSSRAMTKITAMSTAAQTLRTHAMRVCPAQLMELRDWTK